MLTVIKVVVGVAVFAWALDRMVRWASRPTPLAFVAPQRTSPPPTFTYTVPLGEAFDAEVREMVDETRARMRAQGWRP